MANNKKSGLIDFDKFLAERENVTKTVKIFGRICEVPQELPFDYTMKIIRMLEGESNIHATESIKVLGEMFKPEDYAFITQHPKFTMGMVVALIQHIWYSDTTDGASIENQEITEDDLAAQQVEGNDSKKV